MRTSRLKIGSTMKTGNVGDIQIKKFLGAGGQGEVYSVRIGSKDYALKWYFDHMINSELKSSIKNLVDKKSPNNNFLWPIFTVENKGFGYVMDLIPSEYKSLNDWVTRKFDMSISNVIKACYDLTDSFNELHAKGLSYQDISFGNVFINNKNGKILICDNDNVTTNNTTIGSVLGTPKFLAPELVSLKSKFPNADTDRFSLAILLFYLLTLSHPFDGQLEANIKCMDLPAQRKLYGNDAVFIYDPQNNRNRPVKGIHNNAINLWRIWPEFLRDLFTRTFTKGVNSPHERVRETEWSKAFLKLEGTIYRCPNCGKSELIYDSELLRKQGHLNKCLRCNKVPNPPRVRINDYVVVISDGRRIYQHHISNSHNATWNNTVAQFNFNNRNLVFKNLSNRPVTLFKKDGRIIDVGINNEVNLDNEDRLNILGVNAYVRY